MSNHQKRLSAPTTWPVERKTETFTVKASPGPHGETGVPVLILLRDVLEYVDSRKEARYALDRGQVRINGDAVRDERRAVGIFDVVTFDERGEHYRVFPGQGGRLALTPLDPADAESRLGKVAGKRQVTGGATQLTLHDGATIHADGDVGVGDSIILDVETDEIVARFPYEEGALVTAVDGSHSGEIGTLEEITVTPGSNPNSVRVATDDGEFETIEDYLVVIDEAFVEEDDTEPAEDAAPDEPADGLGDAAEDDEADESADDTAEEPSDTAADEPDDDAADDADDGSADEAADADEADDEPAADAAPEAGPEDAAADATADDAADGAADGADADETDAESVEAAAADAVRDADGGDDA
jgi:small subunit ribosomal protein S4e